jgi:hypothetical protein
LTALRSEACVSSRTIRSVSTACSRRGWNPGLVSQPQSILLPQGRRWPGRPDEGDSAPATACSRRPNCRRYSQSPRCLSPTGSPASSKGRRLAHDELGRVPKPTPGDPDSARVVGMACGRETQGRLTAYSMRSANQASPRESSHHAFTGRIQLTAVANHIGQEFGA